MREALAEIDRLRKELSMMQSQMTALLNITQAISQNVRESELFDMYKDFLVDVLKIGKLALFAKDKDNKVFYCPTSHGVKVKQIEEILAANFTGTLSNLQPEGDPIKARYQDFNFVAPGQHKQDVIVYAFIGGFSKKDDEVAHTKIVSTLTNIIAVAIENKRLFKRQNEQQRLKNEIDLAAVMQKTLVPQILPQTDNFELASVYKPHLGEVGGDFFDCLEMPDGRIAFCVADISGKGLAAAIFMANALALLRTSAGTANDFEAFIQKYNIDIYNNTKGDRYLTMFYAEWNPDTRMLRYVNAGHVYPIVGTATGTQLLQAGTTVIGSFDELPFLTLGEVHLPGEALIFCYTDGLTDSTDSKGNPIDDADLMNFVSAHYQLNAQNFNTAMMEMVNAFTGNKPYPDDLTVLTCKIK